MAQTTAWLESLNSARPLTLISQPVGDQLAVDHEIRPCILHLEDDFTDAELVQAMLDAAGLKCQITHVRTEEEFSCALRQHTHDLILADYSLPGYNGISALRLARAECPTVPFLFVSGALGEEVAIEALTQGATDYVLKQRMSRLAPAVQRALCEVEERRERARAEAALRDNEKRFRTLIENSSDGIAVLDRAGVIQYISASGERLIGFPAHGLVGQELTKFIHPEDTAELERSLVNLMRERGQSQVMSARFHCRDGEWRWMEGVYHNLLHEPTLSAIVVNFRDITERKQREFELESIAALSAALRAAESRAAMLPVILDQSLELLNVQGATIAIRHLTTGELVTELGLGEWANFTGVHLAPETSVSGRVIATAQPYVSNAIKDDPLLTRPDLIGDLNCVACVPLNIPSGTIGALWVGRRTPIREEEVRLLTAITDIAANAIHRASLYEQTLRDEAELELAYNTTLEGWARALELRDHETEGHSRRVVSITLALARAMGMAEEKMEDVRRGALLHDIGKMGVPDAILLKPGPLTDEEWKIMQKHPGCAAELLSGIPYLRGSIDIPYCHHEKWDGTGYPCRLKGEQIPLAARIFAIVDVWDALSSDRPYRSAWTPTRVRAYLREQAGVQFDPVVVKAFLEMIAEGEKGPNTLSVGVTR